MVIPSTRSVIKAVEEEFGQPFWDVVRGFASDGYGCDTTARILGYQDPRQFRSLIKRHRVVIKWPAHGQCNVQQERRPLSAETKAKISQKAKERYMARSKDPELVAKVAKLVKQGLTHTLISERLGISRRNVQRLAAEGKECV